MGVILDGIGVGASASALIFCGIRELNNIPDFLGKAV